MYDPASCLHLPIQLDGTPEPPRVDPLTSPCGSETIPQTVLPNSSDKTYALGGSDSASGPESSDGRVHLDLKMNCEGEG
jgi:hypothetical protein